MKYLRNKDLSHEIKTHLRNLDVEILEVGDGILTVKVEEDFNIYFDTGRWRFKVKIRQDYQATLFPVELSNIGFLPGRLISNGIKTFDRVFLVIKQKLNPTAECYKLIDAEIPKEKPRSGFGDTSGFGDIFGDLGDIFKNKK